MSYAKCISNRPYLKPPHQPEQEGALFGLTVGKVYKVISDPIAEQHGMIRIIDESLWRIRKRKWLPLSRPLL